MQEELYTAVGLKINLDWLYNADCPHIPTPVDWEQVIDHLLKPFLCYLDTETNKKPRIKVHHYSAGVHTNGKTMIPHVHFNLHCEHVPQGFNFLTNYKYYYARHFGADTYLTKNHFKSFKHSIKVQNMTDLKGWLSYPFKECTDKSAYWKAYEDSQVDPYTVLELITYGAGVYLASCNAHDKAVVKEELKLEKWGHFCKHMDALRNTPTVNEMGELRGVCLLALAYFRKQPERTSVNAVITMCKDYAFKRGIWTDDQILDKFQIV